MVLRTYAANLHMHTALSPCAGEEMTPRALLAEAARQGLDLIAITDHNTAENVGAVLEAARDFPVRVLPGMEVQTREDVHLICLFQRLEQVLAWQEVIYRRLPARLNDERVFGAQLVADSHDRVVGRVERLLLTSADIGVNEAVEGVRGLGGLCIPAHVDRPAFSLVGHLGFIPPELGFKAVEITPRMSPREAYRKLNALMGYVLVVSSDAHYLADLGTGRTVFYIKDATPGELELAFRGEGGRKVVIPG
ncbi:hypothetical protein SY88_13960 [Clostridiales bacterium PH28_bin88]|nr:hypothetical protein SY88_13960 [Clostridiales bacterium PH28_bin88]